MPDIDPEAWYIYDHVDETVVAQDLTEQEADDRVRERGARCMAVSGAALQEFDAETTISWETDDVRKITDGGAIDNDFEDAERSPETILADAQAEQGGEHELLHNGDLAIDLVTRQPLYIVRCVASTLPAYYENEEFDLLTYKQHQYLPVRMDDPVFECVFVGDLDDLHRERKTYSYPAGRLARVPIEQLAGGED